MCDLGFSRCGCGLGYLAKANRKPSLSASVWEQRPFISSFSRRLSCPSPLPFSASPRASPSVAIRAVNTEHPVPKQQDHRAGHLRVVLLGPAGSVIPDVSTGFA
eukprot:305005-Rhodomonas_salina.2